MDNENEWHVLGSNRVMGAKRTSRERFATVLIHSIMHCILYQFLVHVMKE